jgi:iron complex transport system permease protein
MLPASVAILGILIAMSFCIGRYPLAPRTLVGYALRSVGLVHLAPDQIQLIRSVVIDSRLPRIFGAVLVGAALSTSGGAYQAVFRNPLVSPGSLGVLSGAGFGAALAIVLGYPILIQPFAFAGGLAAVTCGVGVGRLFGEGSIVMLVFGGLISSALFTALLSILKYGADADNQLPDIVFWLLGSLAQIAPGQLLIMAVPLCLGVLLLSLAGRMLDALAMNDDEARTLGVPVTTLRYSVIMLATVVSALTVSLAGIIGWIGLVIPHVARLMVGPGNARLLPLSACLGAIFLLVSDDLARTLFVEEVPIGILTDLIGVVLFLCVLPRARQGWA